MKAYFFGCWNQPGHYWFKPRGVHVLSEEERTIPFSDWIDTGYAPRRFIDGRYMNRNLVADPPCCFITEGKTRDERHSIDRDTEEYQQGMFLLHVRSGWTLISWWDRAQGDRRGACNSNFVLEGEHDEAAMIAALREHFPHVLANLEQAGIELKSARAR